jgi:uncharacterized protein (UPF0548 family)
MTNSTHVRAARSAERGVRCGCPIAFACAEVESLTKTSNKLRLIGQQPKEMFFFTEPSSSKILEFIASQSDLPFSYQTVGATNGQLPVGYTIDHNRVQLGKGLGIYERAVDALKEWKQFDLGWVTIVPVGVDLRVGATVAVKARAFGTWSLSAARVVYLIEEDGPPRRFGFAYGTLLDHVETGEERFTIEWHEEDDSVWYDILAFSRPRHPLVKLSSPLARMKQKRFARESMQRMVQSAKSAS